MIDLYVYYKVRGVDAARLAPLVRAMQERLATQQGVRGQLKRRPEEKDGLQTWMEIYPGVADGFAEVVASAAANAGFDGLIEGPRRAEIFTDLPPCA
ncbi:DUF4936 family protein [Massilia sp. YIM B02443]|uniref:DUF4936 family protein n=1 Tax=Massilia sp. YIM B02443 TaxID=3050127 RepID=UPI0025B728AF|nr:DUF4936 family protein [Massilia sp. YIM B02443]MDN4038565.1 DUF4936 family protein [Massilia sp. YIM B02443]